MGTDDSELNASTADDGNAQSEIDEKIRRLYAYAYRLCGSHHRAEELTQQTFLVAQQREDQLRDRAKLMPWLMRILRNVFLQDVRRNRPAPASQIDYDLEQVEGECSVGDIESNRVQDALDQLGEDQRRVLMMYYFEAWSYREIAAQLDVPIGTVMSRISRAKQQLKQVLLVEQVERIGQGWETL